MSICYAPLNRLVSVYRSAIRETIFKLILFLLFFQLPFSLFSFAGSNEQRKKTCFFSAGIFNGFLGSFQSSDMCKYDSRSRAHIRLSNTILDMLFIGPYGVSRAINSILRLMAMIQTAQAIVTNCTFFMHISFVQFFFGFVSRTPVHVKALITL